MLYWNKKREKSFLKLESEFRAFEIQGQYMLRTTYCNINY